MRHFALLTRPRSPGGPRFSDDLALPWDRQHGRRVDGDGWASTAGSHTSFGAIMAEEEDGY